MSARLMGQVWGLALPRSQRDVLLAMADNANDDGRCYPGVEYLAWKTDYSVRQVQRALAGLKGSKVVELSGGFADGGRGRFPEYTLHLDRAAAKPAWADVKGAKVTPIPAAPERVTSEAERVTSEAQKGDIGDTPSIYEPEVNPPNHDAAYAAGAEAPRPPAALADSPDMAAEEGGTIEASLIEDIETLTGAAQSTAFLALCWAMGLDSARLTAGARAHIAKEAKRLRQLEGAPGARDLLAWCDRERRAVAARYGAGRDPEVMWYITAIGKGIASRRRATLESARNAAAESTLAARVRAAMPGPAEVKATRDWRAIAQRLRASLPPGTFDTWLAEVKPRPGQDERVLLLVMPTERHVDFCRARLLERYLEPAARALGLSLALTVDPALLMSVAPGYNLPAGYPTGNPGENPGGL